jgi:hypothetical protein
MYQREEVTPELLNEHLRQLDETLALIRRIHQTPYRPGDDWVRALPLDETRAAAAAQTLLRAGSIESKPSLLSLYNTHARELLDRIDRAAAMPTPALAPAPVAPPAAPPAESAAPEQPMAPAPTAGGADFLPPILPPTLPVDTAPAAPPPPAPVPPVAVPRTILDALAAADPELGALTRDFAAANGEVAAVKQAVAELEAARAAQRPDPRTLSALEERVDRAKESVANRSRTLEERLARPIARAEQTAVVVKDAIAVTSVTLRLALEAAALASVAVAEAVTLASQSPGAWVRNSAGMAELARDLPARTRSIAAELEADAVAVKGLLGALSKLAAVDPTTTVGFDYRDGLVDEIVGFTWDSVHVEANAGGEAFFYNALANAEKSSGSGATYDYTGRVYKLDYHVDPIVLASARLSASFDWSRLADAAGLKLGYATNRVYKSGGDIQQGSLARELGIKNAWSDALDAALFIAGVKASVRLAQFTSGTVDLVQVADNSKIATFPFAFQLKQIDLGYDFAPRLDSPLHSLTVTLGYFDYTLPRVLYEFQNSTPDADSPTFVYSRESPPQAVRSRFGMLGIAADAERPLVGRLIGVIGARVALGGGPISYYFLKDESLPDEESNRDKSDRFTTGIDAGAFLGVRFRFTSPDTRISAHLDAKYQALLIASELGSNDSSKALNSGSTDLFHGPTLSLGGAF